MIFVRRYSADNLMDWLSILPGFYDGPSTRQISESQVDFQTRVKISEGSVDEAITAM